MADLSRRECWWRLAQQCPFECWLCEVDDTDLVDSIDDAGTPCRRYRFNYVKGTLTVAEVPHGWMFYHPGFKAAQKFVHAFNADVTPGYSHVHLHT